MSLPTPESNDKVVHNYTDRATEADPEPNSEGGRAVPMGVDHTFPTKLHYMLSTSGADHVISWQPHGRCFMVHDMKEFVSSMLPLWFRQSKFASFQRQLNLYGFQRITQGRDKNAYYHEYFLRGRPLLAQKIVRTKVKGKGARKASSPETEPKFYDLPWMKEIKKPAQTIVNGDQVVVTAANPNHTISPTLAALAHLAPAPQAVAAVAPSVLAGAMAMANPPRSLGDALGFLGTLSMSSQATTPLPGGETMFLPTPSANQTTSLNTLLSSFGSAAPAPPKTTTSSVASMYVPIAPAPPREEGEPYKPPALETNNNYGSVLAALKVQHFAPLAPTQATIGRASFTTPGPSPF